MPQFSDGPDQYAAGRRIIYVGDKRVVVGVAEQPAEGDMGPGEFEPGTDGWDGDDDAEPEVTVHPAEPGSEPRVTQNVTAGRNRYTSSGDMTVIRPRRAS